MIEKKYRDVIAWLRRDGRVRLTKIARKTGIPVSTVFNWVHGKTLGITRFSALLDFEAIGCTARATMLFKAENRERLRNFLLRSPEVNSLVRVNNGYDFMADCVFRDMRELELFVDALERAHGVRKKEVHYVIEELKREEFMSEVERAEGQNERCNKIVV
jgi:DNA-binding Lrp family transcriptional regulator